MGGKHGFSESYAKLADCILDAFKEDGSLQRWSLLAMYSASPSTTKFFKDVKEIQDSAVDQK